MSERLRPLQATTNENENDPGAQRECLAKAWSEASRVADEVIFRGYFLSKPNDRTVLRSVQVEVADIAYLRFLLEAHDGLAVPTTRQGTSDIIDFVIAPDFEEEFDELLAALSGELKLIPVPSPQVSPLCEEG